MLIRVRLPQLELLSKTLMIARYASETFKTTWAACDIPVPYFFAATWWHYKLSTAVSGFSVCWLCNNLEIGLFKM